MERYQSLPPLELDYWHVLAQPAGRGLSIFDGIAELNDGTHYRMVDLYGDGVPGVLFRHGGSLRHPLAAIPGTSGTDEIVYDDWQVLPQVPSMQPVRLALMDIDGDGRLDWLVTQPGMAGCFSFRKATSGRTLRRSTHCRRSFSIPRLRWPDLVGAGGCPTWR